jgi:hypothetical protein
MLRRLLATVGLVAIAAAPLQAQIPLLDVRIGAQGALPQGDFADAYDAGIGAYARVGVPLLFFKAMASAQYTRFKSINPLVEDRNVLLIGAGPHFSPLPLLDVGFEAAYDSDAKEWAWNPNVSVGFLMLEATAGYVKPMKNGDGWATLGVGFRF